MRKYAREWVAKYPSIAKIHEAIAGVRRMGSEGTVEAYIKGIKNFVAYMHLKNPETALQKLLSGEKDPGAEVDTFIDYALEKQGKAHNHVRNHVFGIKKWFELNGVKVDWDKIELPTSAEIREEDRAPTKDELKKLLNHGKARDRAIIFCDSSSGLRIGTLLSLKKGDADFSYPDVVRLTVERKRGRKFTSKRRRTNGRFFCTFITPEARKSLLQYFKEREAAGETLTDESPLIGDAYHKGHFISTEAYEKVWARLLRRAGLDQKSTSWFVLHIHTLRKYFRSNCVGVDPSYRERWMGHKGLYLDMSYFKAEEPLHLAEYRKAVPQLTIYSSGMAEETRMQIVVDTLRALGTTKEDLKRLEDIYARAKDVDASIEEFRRLKDDANEARQPSSHRKMNGKYSVAKGEAELVQRLSHGWNLVQPLSEDKYLLERN